MEDKCLKYIEDKCYELIKYTDILMQYKTKLVMALERIAAGDDFLLPELDRYSRAVLISKEQCYTLYRDVSQLAYTLDGKCLETFRAILAEHHYILQVIS